MDKIELCFFIVLMLSVLSGCDRKYEIDDNYIIGDDKTVISSVNGYLLTDNGIYIYGQAKSNWPGIRLPKGDHYGLLKLNYDGEVDSNFQNPFNIPTSVHQMIQLPGGKYFLIYNHFQEKSWGKKILNMAILNNSGQLSEIDFDFKRFYLKDSLDQEYIHVNAIDMDVMGNIYIAFSYLDNKALIPLLKLDSNFIVDEIFLKNIMNCHLSGKIYSIMAHKEGKIILGGNFTIESDFYNIKNLCRINENGQVDIEFQQNISEFGGNDYDRIYCIEQIDSTIYLGGNFSIKNKSKKIDDLFRINQNGEATTIQPNQNNIFQYIDDEPYFNKSTILSIKEFNDSLLLVSGIFNYINKSKTNFPISIISKKGDVTDNRFISSNEIFYIKSCFIKSKDTIYFFGNDNMVLNSDQAFGRLIKN